MSCGCRDRRSQAQPGTARMYHVAFWSSGVQHEPKSRRWQLPSFLEALGGMFSCSVLAEFGSLGRPD